jgi:hypothetical protein
LIEIIRAFSCVRVSGARLKRIVPASIRFPAAARSAIRIAEDHFAICVHPARPAPLPLGNHVGPEEHVIQPEDKKNHDSKKRNSNQEGVSTGNQNLLVHAALAKKIETSMLHSETLCFAVSAARLRSSLIAEVRTTIPVCFSYYRHLAGDFPVTCIDLPFCRWKMSAGLLQSTCGLRF